MRLHARLTALIWLDLSTFAFYDHLKTDASSTQRGPRACTLNRAARA
jgi:hypothetical protein